MLIYYIWIILFFSGTLTLSYLIIFKLYFRATITRRIHLKRFKDMQTPSQKLSTTFGIAIVPVKRKLLHITPINMIRKLERNIMLSGTKWELGDILLLKLLLVLVSMVLGFFITLKMTNTLLGILLMLLLILLTFFLPDIILILQIKPRKEAIQNSLPPFIDYLTISVEAGLGLDLAISRVISKLNGPLAEEIAYTMTEIKYGKPKKAAYKALAAKVDLPEFTTFLTTLINGEQLGMSLGDILKVQGEQIREKKKQRIQEKAYKIPIKLLFPLVIFILPNVFIVILGPAVIMAMDTLLK